jgi:capsular exopolysaccharide synthesis family protein
MNMDREADREASLAADLRYVFGVLRAKAWLIVLCLAVSVGLGVAYLFKAPKIYSATTVIQISQEEPILARLEAMRNDDLKEPQVIKTYEQNLVSPEVLLRVVNHPELADDPDFLPGVTGVRSATALQAALALHVTAKIRRETRLIDISVEHRIPALAQRISGLLVDEFILWSAEARREEGEKALSFLREQAGPLNERLLKSEQALQAYKELHGDVTLQDKQNVSLEKLNQLNLRVTEAKAERLKLEADAAQLGRAKSRSVADLLKVPSVANAPAIADLIKKIGDEEAAAATLRKRYGPGHPNLIAAQGKLDELRTGLKVAVLQMAEVLEARLQEVKRTEEALEQAFREQQKLTLGVDSVTIGYAALVREVESNRALYESVLKRMKETDITKEITQDFVRVIARPLLPEVPVKPKKNLILALTILAGLGSGCFLAFALHAADRSIKTLDDAEARIGLRALSEIPRIRPPGSLPWASSARIESDLAAVEAFRGLRTSLSLVGVKENPKSVLFTSALPGEGKTFCAINCAVSFAQIGLKTLLIDAGYRMPKPGAVLFDGTELRSVDEQGAAAGSANGSGNGSSHAPGGEQPNPVRDSHVPNLSILSAHGGDLSSVDFLGGDTLENFMRRAGSQFDRIVVDGAPVNKVSDTLIFARHVQSVCLVILAGQTPTQDVLRAVQRLAETGAPVVGFVWNQFKPGAGDFPRQVRALPSRTTKQLLS